MKMIVYSRPDGGVSVVVPSPGVDIDHIMAKDIPPDATDVSIVEASEIPKDRTFRGAWKRGAVNPIEVDMQRARNIHMGRIRRARDAELSFLDRAYLLADETGNAAEKDRIAATKQKLRDIPQTFDLSVASTPDELNALWPSHLSR